MKKILFITPYPKDVAPSQRLKFEQYYSHIENSGFKVDYSSFIDIKFWKIIYKKGYLFSKVLYTILAYINRIICLFRIRKYDIIYVHLWVTPFGPPIFEFLVKLLSKKLIYDIDDMIYLGHKSKSNKLIAFIKGKTKPIYLIKNAVHVVTCTPYLDDFVKKYNRNTTDISSTINTDLYIPKKEYNPENQIILGWSGSHSTSKYLNLLEPVFEKLLVKGVKFKVLVIGDITFSFKNKKIELECIKWQLDTEVDDLKKIDIGLYPLPNEKWVFGKSGLKALQYMSLGIPTIAQAIGTNYRIIKNYETGFLVNEIEEWVEVIEWILKNKDKVDIISHNAIDFVKNNYSVNSNKEKYISILNQCINN